MWLATLGLYAACSADAPDAGETAGDESSTSDRSDAGSVGGKDAASLDAGGAGDGGSTRDSGASDASGAADDASTVGGSGALPATRPTACAGKPLPPRALRKLPPFAVGPASAGLPAYWPTAGWRSEDPEKLGFDAAKLKQAVMFSTPYSSTQAVFVVRHGYVAAEWYARGFAATTQHESYSMAKSFSSGLIGIAIAEGKLGSTDDKVCTFYPMLWDCSDSNDARSRISIDHAMNLNTGLIWQEDWRSTASGTNDAYSPNMLDTVLARKSSMEPGLKKRYSTGDPALLSGVLQKATGMTALEYAKQKVFDVIGTPGIRWNADSKGRTTTYAGLQASAAEYAKYGYLYLQRGSWDGKQVIPAAWVDRTTQATHPCEDWNQYLWHVNPPVRLGAQDPACDGLFCLPTSFADLPADAFFAEGVNGQFVFIVPSSDLVIVRLANDQPGSEHWDEFASGFLSAVLGALE
jgi:CubicO group peptidase (beta-lactamase class C family)